MGLITAKAEGAAPATPPSGYVTLYTDGSVWKYKTDSGSVFTFSTGVTAEEVQDIVGAFFADSSSIDVTYNDAGDVISATVIASGVNHNALQNYVANQHVDHSAVSITAGTGLSGGGDLTATRTLNIANVGTAGTYRSVTTNAQGQVTAGTNPTTLAGYGITDAQPLDGDLTAVAGLTGTGLVTRTASNTMTTRTVTAGTGISVANGDGVSGNPTVTNSDTGSAAVATHVGLSNPHTQYLQSSVAATTYQPLDGDLTAVAGLATTGLITRTAANTAQTRTLTAGTGITVTNGDGVSGNPTVAITNTAVTPGTYGSSAFLPVITVNAQGQLTSVTTAASASATLGNLETFSDSDTITTTSTSYVASDRSLSLTAGTWRVTYHANVSSTSNNRCVTTALFLNGTIVAGSKVLTRIADGNALSGGLVVSTGNTSLQQNSATINIVVASTQTVDIRWFTSAGTAVMQERILTALRIA